MRLTEPELAAMVVRNRVAADYFVSEHPQRSLEDVLPLVHAHREALAALEAIAAHAPSYLGRLYVPCGGCRSCIDRARVALGLPRWHERRTTAARE